MTLTCIFLKFILFYFIYFLIFYIYIYIYIFFFFWGGGGEGRGEGCDDIKKIISKKYAAGKFHCIYLPFTLLGLNSHFYYSALVTTDFSFTLLN